MSQTLDTMQLSGDDGRDAGHSLDFDSDHDHGMRELDHAKTSSQAGRSGASGEDSHSHSHSQRYDNLSMSLSAPLALSMPDEHAHFESDPEAQPFSLTNSGIALAQPAMSTAAFDFAADVGTDAASTFLTMPTVANSVSDEDATVSSTLSSAQTLSSPSATPPFSAPTAQSPPPPAPAPAIVVGPQAGAASMSVQNASASGAFSAPMTPSFALPVSSATLPQQQIQPQTQVQPQTQPQPQSQLQPAATATSSIAAQAQMLAAISQLVQSGWTQQQVMSLLGSSIFPAVPGAPVSAAPIAAPARQRSAPGPGLKFVPESAPVCFGSFLDAMANHAPLKQSSDRCVCLLSCLFLSVF